MQRIFLSYARSDDTEFVAKLYHDLTKHGFDVWWDMEKMPNRALTFLQEIRDAVHVADRLIAVIGPNAIKSDYVRAEWEYALLFCKGVVPILRIGDYNLIPLDLNEDLFGNVPKLHCPDFRVERPYEEAIQELLRILSQPLAQLGDLNGVPPLPPHYQPRIDDLVQVGKTVLEDTQAPIVITAEKQSLALYGMGGIGKTVLASAFARMRDVRRTFHDGIIWLRIGREPDILQRMQEVAQTFGKTDADFSHKDSARNHLTRLLADKCCLIFLDDVWKIDDAVPFWDAINDSRCRLLITTRNKEIVDVLDARDVKVDLMNNEASLKLVADWSGLSVENLPRDDAKEIVKQCGRLPLALTMTGAMLRDQPLSYWKNVLYKFETSDIEKIRKDFGQDHYPYDNLLLAMHISVEALEPKQQALYPDFAVFPEDITIPESTIKTFWASEGLDKYETEDIISTLVRRSLAFRDAENRIYLHDIQRDYVRGKAGDLKPLHNRLLDAYCRLYTGRPTSKRWWNSMFRAWYAGPDDGYYFQYLAWHLVQADRSDELKKLLFDYRWIKAKLLTTNIRALLTDYNFLKDNDALISIQKALRLSSHIVADDRNQLASQLLGRLTTQPMGMNAVIRSPLHFFTSLLRHLRIQPNCIDSLLRQITTDQDSSVWLRPISPSLALPHESPYSILYGHRSFITAIALAHDARHAISASEDGTLIMWDLESGMDIQKLQGHTGRINDVALSADSRFAVSVSNDKTIRVWDLHSRAESWRFTDLANQPWKVAVDPMGRQLICGDSNGNIISYNFRPEGEAINIRSLKSWVRSLEITPDARLVIAATDNGFSIWNLQTHVWEDRCVDGGLQSARITPDLRNIICGVNGGYIYIWDISTKSFTETIKAHNRRINAVEISCDGKIVLSGSEDGTIAAWHLKSRKYLGSYSGNNGFITDIGILPGKDMFLSGSEDRTLRLYEFRHARNKYFWYLEQQMKIFLRLEQIPLSIQRAFFIASTPFLIARIYMALLLELESNDKEKEYILKKRLLGGDEKRSKLGHERRVIAIIPKEKRMVVSVSTDSAMLVWNSQTGRGLRKSSCFIFHDRGKDHLTCADGSTLIALGSYRGDLQVIEMLGSHLASDFVLANQPYSVTAVAVDFQGRYAVVAGDCQGIELWDLYSQEKIRKFKSFNHCDTVYALALTIDGRYALSTSEDKTIRVWDVQTGNELRRLYKNVAYLTLSRSDVIARTYRQRLVDLDWGKERMDERCPRGRARSVAVLPDRRAFVAGFENGIIRMYDFRSLELLWSLQAHADCIRGLSITSDGKYLASISDDRSMRIWSLKEKPLRRAIFTCDHEMTACSIVENGPVFVAGDSSGQVHFLRLEGT